jgi:hypothetical protein
MPCFTLPSLEQNAHITALSCLRFQQSAPSPASSEVRLVEACPRKVDGAFGGVEVLQFALECLDHGRTGKQTAMVFECGEPKKGPFVIKGWNSITDRLCGLRWYSGSNCRPNFIQGAAGRFPDTSKVFVHGRRSSMAFRDRTAIHCLHLFHTGNPPRRSFQRCVRDYHAESACKFNITLILPCQTTRHGSHLIPRI